MRSSGGRLKPKGWSTDSEHVASEHGKRERTHFLKHGLKACSHLLLGERTAVQGKQRNGRRATRATQRDKEGESGEGEHRAVRCIHRTGSQ